MQAKLFPRATRLMFVGAAAELVLVLLALQHQRATADYSFTLLAHEGDRIYIPCFAQAYGGRIDIWRINGVVYPTYALPDWLDEVPKYGLFVHTITVSAQGNYSCYAYNNASYTMEEISSVRFTVMRDTDGISNAEHCLSTGDVDFSDQDYTKEMEFKITGSDVLFIPCLPAIGTNEVLMWEIDGRLYLDTDLPFQHLQHFGGIIVYNSSSAGNNYKCYRIEDISDRYHVQQLYFVSLSRKFDSRFWTKESARNCNRESKVEMTVHHVHLDENFKTFGFGIQSNNCPNCSLGLATFEHEVLLSSSSLPIWDKSTIEPIVQIPSHVFQQTSAFVRTYVSSNNYVCGNLSYTFRVDPEETTQPLCTLSHDACIDVRNFLKEGELVSVTWPHNSTSDMDDCTCPLFYPGNRNGPHFKDCHCVNDTAYIVSFNKTHVCWDHLNESDNNTNVIIFKQLSLKDSVSVKLRVILSESRIIAQGLQPPRPNVVQNHTSICVNSMSAADRNPIVNTTFVAFDISADVVQNISRKDPTFCLQEFTGGFPSSCLPFDVEVTSHTMCTTSPTTHLNSTGNGNLCGCLKAKVNLTMSPKNITQESISVIVDIQCLHLENFTIDRISNLYLNVLSTRNNSMSTTKPLNVVCSNPSTEVTISDLLADTEYQFSIVWRSPSNSTFNCSINMPLTVSTGKKGSDTQLWKVGVSIASSVLALIVIVITICVICWKWKKIRCQTLNGESASEAHTADEKGPYEPLKGQNNP